MSLEVFLLEPAATMHWNDLLKSVNSEDDAIKLIKNLRSMCNEGGFNLTIFVSNSKKVLHSISETFRRNGVKDKDLGCKLPDEQVLGIRIQDCH